MLMARTHFTHDEEVARKAIKDYKKRLLQQLQLVDGLKQNHVLWQRLRFVIKYIE